MHKEHAININKNITDTELEYILKKANRLGQSGRCIHSIIRETDSENVEHLIFLTDPPQTRYKKNCC